MRELIAELTKDVGEGLVEGIAALIQGDTLEEARAKVIESIAAKRAKEKFPNFDPG